MIVATWNVNSLNVRLSHVIDWLQRCQPEILCIQETKLTDDKFPVDAFAQAGYHCEYFGEKAYNGVSIISKGIPTAIQKGFPDDAQSDSKRFIEITVGPISIINVYIPNGQEVGSEKFHYKLAWIERLKNYLKMHHQPEDMVVICGDFNVAVEDRDVYDPSAMAGQILFSEAEKSAIQSLYDWGFIDTFRLHHKESGLYSWWDYRAMAFRRKLGLRIDHIWATRPLASVCTRSWIDVEPRKLEKPSDHTPVASEFKTG